MLIKILYKLILLLLIASVIFLQINISSNIQSVLYRVGDTLRYSYTIKGIYRNTSINCRSIIEINIRNIINTTIVLSIDISLSDKNSLCEYIVNMFKTSEIIDIKDNRNPQTSDILIDPSYTGQYTNSYEIIHSMGRAHVTTLATYYKGVLIESYTYFASSEMQIDIIMRLIDTSINELIDILSSVGTTSPRDSKEHSTSHELESLEQYRDLFNMIMIIALISIAISIISMITIVVLFIKIKKFLRPVTSKS